MRLAVAMVLALPALLQGQDTDDNEKRAQFFFHANYLQEIPNLEETRSFTRFLEQGSASRTYTGGSGTAFEIGGMYALLSRFSIGWSFEFLETMQNGTLAVSEPHPLMFDRSREASKSLDELGYSELTVHFAFAYRIATPRVEVELFAGPSLFTTEVEIIAIATVESQYPFDEISLSGGDRVTLKDSGVGFNVGAGMAYYFTEIFGASFSARFSQTDLKVMREGGEPIAIKAGGFRVGGGLRIRF